MERHRTYTAKKQELISSLFFFLQVWFSNHRSKSKSRKFHKPEADEDNSPESTKTRIFYPSYPVVPVIRYAPYPAARVFPYMHFRPIQMMTL